MNQQEYLIAALRQVPVDMTVSELLAQLTAPEKLSAESAIAELDEMCDKDDKYSDGVMHMRADGILLAVLWQHNLGAVAAAYTRAKERSGFVYTVGC
jgi:hypothetical protein